jgi:MFS family permease
MQFYETLPNFIFDWIDTSMIVSQFSLPEVFTVQTESGQMLSYETLFSINSFLIILFIVPVSWIFTGKKITSTILIGIIISTVGLFLSGSSMVGYFTVAGIMLYTFGEMITNPRFNEYMAKIAPIENKSQFMGYMSISWAAGLAGGGLLGGYIYKYFGEKSGFAIKYLNENFNIQSKIDHSNALNLLMDKTGMNIQQVTSMLWQNYNPWQLWIPFVIISLISVVGLYFYSRKYE